MVGDQAAKRVIGQPRNPRGGATKTGQSNSGIQLGATDLHIKAVGLFEPAVPRRAKRTMDSPNVMQSKAIIKSPRVSSFGLRIQPPVGQGDKLSH